MSDHLPGFLIQEFLDGELPAIERLRAEAHLARCARCAAERDRAQGLLARLSALPARPVPAQLEARILAAVVPELRARAERRQRVWRFVGALYATGTAASLAAIASLFVLPAPRAWAHDLAAAATHTLAGAFVFVCRSLNAAILGFADGMSLWHAVSLRAAPFGRALVRVFEVPVVSWGAMVAVFAAVLLLWWIRPRAQRGWKGESHVGVLSV